MGMALGKRKQVTVRQVLQIMTTYFCVVMARCSRLGGTLSQSVDAQSTQGMAGESHRAMTPTHCPALASSRMLSNTSRLGAAKPISNIQLRSTPVEIERTLFFGAEDGVHGNELWASDGDSVWLALDLEPGPTGSNPIGMVHFSTTVIFSARTSTNGVSLHECGVAGLLRPDGSATCATINNTEGAQAPCTVTNNGQQTVYFAAYGGSDIGTELFRYNGSGVGTLVADIEPGSWSSEPSDLTSFDGRLYFSARTFFQGRELYWYNGTGFPSMVADLNPGPGSSAPRELSVWPRGLFLQAQARSQYTELYVVSNITDSSSQPTLELVLPASSGWFRPKGVVQVSNDTIVLTASKETATAALQLISLNVAQQNATPQVILSQMFYPSLVTLGPRGVVYLRAFSSYTGSEPWGYDYAGEPFAFLAQDIWPGDQSSLPGSFAAYEPPGLGRQLLYFSARNGTGITQLWAYDDQARPSPTPSVTPSVSPTLSPSSSPSTSSTPSASASASPSVTPSVSPTPSPSISASPSPSTIPDGLPGDAGTRSVFMQVAVAGVLQDSTSRNDGATGTSLEALRRGVPLALVEATGLQQVRARPSIADGSAWVDRLAVAGAKPDSDSNQSPEVQVLVEVVGPGAEDPLGGGGGATPGDNVASSEWTRQLVNERLLQHAEADSGRNIINTTVGIYIVATLGAESAVPCRCYPGEWIVPSRQYTCPTVEVNARALTIGAISIAILVPSVGVYLRINDWVSFSGSLTVISVGLQILDVVSDASFAYQLTRERLCDYPVLVYVAISSIGASIAINLVLAVVVLRWWAVDGVRDHTFRHFAEVSAVAFLSIFGVKALDLLTSQLGNRAAFSLYSSGSDKDVTLRRELSHRVRVLGLFYLFVEDAVQLVVQIWALTLKRRGVSMIGLLALAFTAVNVLRHLVSALLSTSGIEGLNRRSRLASAQRHSAGVEMIVRETRAREGNIQRFVPGEVRNAPHRNESIGPGIPQAAGDPGDDVSNTSSAPPVNHAAASYHVADVDRAALVEEWSPQGPLKQARQGRQIEQGATLFLNPLNGPVVPPVGPAASAGDTHGKHV